uniref:Uncharacterized protein n=1 Tax=Escherichia coli TaxID=562 RepID=A0A3G4RTJ7_ECOLX|nr:hypothetical protein D0368_00286 [Escherichia coli]
MNYAGHEKLRAEVAEVANAMCDLRNNHDEMERRYSFNADTLPERLVRQTLFRRKPPPDGGIYRNSGTGFLLQRLRGESMYGTCEILCRELAAKYPADTPLDAGCLVP